MRLLSAVLVNLPTDLLTSVQLNFISTFYCDRLKDHHSVVPNTLTGIEALVKMVNLPDECAARLLQAMFQNVPCQSQVRDDRTKIFNIFSELCDSKTTGNQLLYAILLLQYQLITLLISFRIGEHGPGFCVWIHKCDGRRTGSTNSNLFV